MRTSFAGPAYGAKSELISGSRAVIATSQTNAIVDLVIVPVKEDWYITQVTCRAETTGSAAGTLDVFSNGVSILSGAVTFTTTGATSVTTASSGEDEGVKVASGNTITIVVTSSATTAPGNMNYHVYGYPRNVR